MNAKLKTSILLLSVTMLSGLLMPTASAFTTCPLTSVQEFAQNNRLNPLALKLALSSYQWAVQKGFVKNTQYITLVDFTLPSYEKRLYVIDLKNDRVVLNSYVAHGKNSGLTNTVSFSDTPGSDQSMYGAFITSDPYVGKHGTSLRVQGLEKGINDTAMRRAVVIHSAWYASPTFVNEFHRAGRSDGCFAVGPEDIKPLINDIKDQSFLYAYAPEERHDPIAPDVEKAV